VLVAEALACLLGLVLLARSSDMLVLGCSRLAERVGVPAVVVGVVVIGFGTSAPELLVSASAAAAGSAALGVGNVIGSNIANLTLVLGAAALVAPVTVRVSLVRREVPMALGASVAFGLALQGGVSRPEAFGLLAGLAACLLLLVRWALAGRAAGPGTAGLEQEVDQLLGPQRRWSLSRLAVQAGVGLAGTLLGAQALVWGAVGVARGAGLSEGFVGVTVVAVGTSLPELLTAAQAARRGESDLVVGNLMGSNLFNALGVGGLIGLMSPGVTVGRALSTTGVLVMIAVSLLAMAFMMRGFRVVRWEGAVLVATFMGCLPLMAGG
jgi:cation:H+ antiporter